MPFYILARARVYTLSIISVNASSGILLRCLLYTGRSASFMCISVNPLSEEHVVIPIFWKRTVTQGDTEQAQGHSWDWDLNQVLAYDPNPNIASFYKCSANVGWTVLCGHTPKEKKREKERGK